MALWLRFVSVQSTNFTSILIPYLDSPNALKLVKKISNQKKGKIENKLKWNKYVVCTYKVKLSPPVPPPVESDPYSLRFQRSVKATKLKQKLLYLVPRWLRTIYVERKKKWSKKHAHSRTLCRIKTKYETKMKWRKLVLLTPLFM